MPDWQNEQKRAGTSRAARFGFDGGCLPDVYFFAKKAGRQTSA
ncbi:MULTISPECIES: hypothetical protein [unclassified Rhizobium]|nr:MULTISPECIES: hypothetical protein [unclassified Rhizobium]